MTPRAASRSAGFTLIEILVSISLLAMLLLIGYAAISTAVRSARSGEALIARTEELRTAQVFLRRQLAGALGQVYRADEGTATHYRFEGNRDEVVFVATMPGYLSRGGAHVQRLALVSERGQLQLEFNHSQLNGFEDGDVIGDERDPVVLVDGIADAAFEFRTLEPDGQFGEWSSDWDTPQMLPQQVRLRMEFPSDDTRRWPELLVPLRLAGAGGLGPTQGRLEFQPARGTVPRPEQ